MSVTTIREARANLARLIKKAESGEEVVIARGKQPVVRLAIAKGSGKRPVGLFKGKFTIPDHFSILFPRNWTSGKSNPRACPTRKRAWAWDVATRVVSAKWPDAEYLADERTGMLPGPRVPGPEPDPFDRMLIGRAQSENLPIVSSDRIFDEYHLRRIW